MIIGNHDVVGMIFNQPFQPDVWMVSVQLMFPQSTADDEAAPEEHRAELRNIHQGKGPAAQ
jgi:hypothetical protein